MTHTGLKADKRPAAKKKATARLRRDGFIPAVIYGRKEVQSISLNEKELLKALSGAHSNTIFDLDIEGKVCQALIKDMQEDICTGKILHTDFLEIEKGKKLRTGVPVRVEGTAVGVKTGGLLEYRLHSLDIECLPKDIPECIAVDITSLQIGEAVHISDIVLPDGVVCHNLPAQTIVSVTKVRGALELEQDLEEEAGEEGQEKPEASG